MSTSQKELVRAAIKAAGGSLKVAYEMGLSGESTVLNWARVGRVPPARVVQLCEMGGNQYRPDQLRPDVFRGASA